MEMFSKYRIIWTIIVAIASLALVASSVLPLFIY